MTKPKLLTRILSFLLVLTVLLPYVPAEAIYFDGSSGGNTEGTTVKGDTNLQDLDAVIAYRFTGLKADGRNTGIPMPGVLLFTNLPANCQLRFAAGWCGSAHPYGRHICLRLCDPEALPRIAGR